MTQQNEVQDSSLLEFLRDKCQNTIAFVMKDGDGYRAVVTVTRQPMCPGYLGIICSAAASQLPYRDREWLDEYAHLLCAASEQYEIRENPHHAEDLYLVRLGSLSEATDSLLVHEQLVHFGHEFLYWLRGLDDLTKIWREQFKEEGYPSPSAVIRWLGPYGSVFQ